MTEDGRRIKAYALTTAGRRQLTAEKRQWERIVAAVGQVLETN
jgi:DNA-binding PadR family transcriptional regulator